MSEKAHRVVVVGGVAAGMKTASRIRRLDPAAEITVIDRAGQVSYGACALPYYLEGAFEDLDEVRRTPAGSLRDPDFFRKVKGFAVRTGTEALAIDRERKRLRVRALDTGAEEDLAYDALVLATGSRPVMAPLPGSDLSGVCPLKTPGDAEELDALAAASREAVIVGGGLIGLETAEALVQRGLKVTLVEMQEQVLPGALEPGLAALVHRELRRNGVALRFGELVRRLEGEDGRVTEVVTGKGRYRADLVVMAVGVRPEAELAEAAGLKLGAGGAVAVDAAMRTSDPDIYAAGDCAASVHRLSGEPVYLPLGSTANKQGRVAADAICGRPERFPGILGTLIVKVFGLNVGRTGLSEAEARAAGYDAVTALAASPDRAHVYPGVAPLTIRLVAERTGRRLLGVQIVGPGAVDKRLDTAVAALTLGATVDQVANFDLAYAPPYAAAMDALIQAANTLRNKLDGLGESLDPEVVQEKLAAGAEVLLLDVRSPEEFQQVRVPGAALLPLDRLREKLDSLPKDQEIVPYCKLSLRGYEAQRILKGAGFERVRFMEGGILGWPFELETGPPRDQVAARSLGSG